MALEGWVAWHGQGKTYGMVAHMLDQWDEHGIPIASNAQLAGAVKLSEIGEIDAARVPPAMTFETWDELMALIEVAIELHLRLQVGIDEAGKWLSSRFWNKMDPRVLTVLQERRKVGAGLDMYWTAPHLQHVDRQLRDVTQVIHTVRRYGGSEYSHDGGKPPWAFLQRSYKPTDMSTDAQGTKQKAKPLKRRLLPFSPALASCYTTGLVNMAKPVSDELEKRPDYRGTDDVVDERPATVVQLRVGKR